MLIHTLPFRSISTFLLLIILSVIQFGCGTQSSQNSTGEKEPVVVFLVRHAEKVDSSKDPELSEAGKKRAMELVKTLKNANIKYVHSSDYIRTRETAAPVAEEFGLTIEIYDPSNLEALASKVKETSGNHLIVGHSNTTPKMVGLLGGDPVSKIEEKGEYDRIYKVTIAEDGSVNSSLTRYGASYDTGMDN
ncbi:MAG: histidine phosphatase family protein [Cyclobacteriaceae bacterium]